MSDLDSIVKRIERLIEHRRLARVNEARSIKR
jgi:hypothetical protein